MGHTSVGRGGHTQKRVGLADCQLYRPGKETAGSSSGKCAVGVLTLTHAPHPLCLGRVLYVTVVSGVLSVSSTLGGTSLVTPPWALHFPNSGCSYLGQITSSSAISSSSQSEAPPEHGRASLQLFSLKGGKWRSSICKPKGPPRDAEGAAD